MALENFLQIDLPALLAATLASISCALVGSFLVLRKQALMGDALSHAVLPGIVVGFLLAGSIAHPAILLGAFGACLVAVLAIEIIKKVTGVEEGAVMGVVFTSMFAFGVFLLEQKVGSRVHLDTRHALYGVLELSYWPGLENWGDLLTKDAWAAMPHHLYLLGSVAVMISVFILLFYKELKITAFDPMLSDTLGFKSNVMTLFLMALVAFAAVAAFSTVGSILVIALLICPPATARMLTDKLSTQLWLSALIGIFVSVTGYCVAAYGFLLPARSVTLNAAGMIAISAGFVQLLAMLFSPRYGAVSRRLFKKMAT